MSQYDENHKLNELLKNAPVFAKSKAGHTLVLDDEGPCDVPGSEPKCSDKDLSGLVQWTTSDGKRFVPASQTAQKITPGVYEIMHSNTIGIYFEKIPVITEGLLRFPQTNSEKVVQEIQKFWDKEVIFREYGLTHKRGIIMWGPPGCHAKGTLIRMCDGSVKNVEDVCEGDELMGPDSEPRKVLELKRGREEMYRIFPTKGESFVVNANHVLHLERSRGQVLRRKSRSKVKSGIYYTKENLQAATLDVTVLEYLNFSNNRKYMYKLRYSDAIKMNEKKLPIDPYFFGLWLGDGHKKAPGYYTPKGDNPVMNALRQLDVLHNKHIPDCYLQGSIAQRRSLLAGLIDTDGHYSNGKKCESQGYRGYYEITQKLEVLANGIVALARSLGLLATIKPVIKTIKKIGFKGIYYKVSIAGDLTDLPMRISHKVSHKGRPNKNNLRTSIKKIIPLKVNDYYGFSLDKDQLYLTADYMVHHNSGKSCTIQLIMKDVIDRNGVVIKFNHPTLFNEGMRKFREIEPITPVVVLMEDIDSILANFNESDVLNILDGVNQIEKSVFLATTNYPENLGARIINRPSRFDKRFFIGHPDEESRKLYFRHIIGDDKIKELKIDLNKWVADTGEFSIAHLKELFTAVVILGDDYSEAITVLREMKEEHISSDNDESRKSMGFATKMKIGAYKTRKNTYE